MDPRGPRHALNQGVWMMVGVVLSLLLLLPGATSQGTITDVSLKNGTVGPNGAYRTGRIEVRDITQWKTLCDVEQDIEFAVSAICRELDFKYGTLVGGAHYGNGTQPRSMAYLHCGEGDRLTYCDVYDRSTDCSAAGAVCFNSSEDALSLRLVDGKTQTNIKTGRLEAKMADLSWGSVCYSMFEANLDDTDEACRRMGFQYGQLVLSSTMPTSPQTFKYDVSLTNDVSIRLQHQCQEQMLSDVRCVNATVRLQTTLRDALTVGKVEIYESGSWTEVCDDGWDDTGATVACKELGFVSGLALTGKQLGGEAWDKSGSSGRGVIGVNCNSAQDRLADCPRVSQGSAQCQNDASRRASVICFDKNIDDVNMDLKAGLVLADGSDTQGIWGHVQVRYKGFWGDVCPDAFTDAEASVACRMLGYSIGVSQNYDTADVQFANSSWSSRRVSAKLPVWINSVSCVGNETTLNDCKISSWGPPSVTQCRESAYVICSHQDIKLKLYNSGLHYGPLEVEHDGNSGPVCGENFEDHDAAVACKTLGYFSGKVLKGDRVSSVPGSPLLSDLKCGVGETSLFHCDSDWKSKSLTCATSAEQAAVSCFNDIELRYGTTHRSGMVVMYENGTHSELGKICDFNFTNNDAQVVCRHIGFTNGYALPRGVYGSGQKYKMIAPQLSGLQCEGDETSVWNCPVDSAAQSSCYSVTSDYASVSCFNTSTPGQSKYSLDLMPLAGNDQAGQVNIFYKETTGFVCTSSWTNNEAHVLCKSKFSSTGGIAFYYPGTYSGPFFATNFTCNPDSNFDACSSMIKICDRSLAAGVLCYQTSAPKVRIIAEGRVPGRGRVSIEVDGVDGRVCGHKWGDTDAMVVCKAAGYQDGLAITFPRSSQDVVMFDLECDGIEESLFNCKNPGWRQRSVDSCSGNGDTEAGVVCFKNVKLSDGEVTASTISGTLQVLKKTTNQWYSVCNEISATEMRVACSELGFTNGTFFSPVVDKRSFGYTFDCLGNETSLSQCSNTTFFCKDGKRAHLFCFNASSDTSWSWNIEHDFNGEVRVTYQGTEGRVCRTGWDDAAANTLCRQRNYMGGTAFGSSVPRASSVQLVWLGAVSCPQDAQNMDQCIFNKTVPADCRDADSMSAAVLCYQVSAPALRLVGGDNKTKGWVQLEYDGVNGTICDKNWDDIDAIHLCRQLNFSTGVASHNSYTNPKPSPNHPVYLSGIDCDPIPDNGEGNVLACRNKGWSVSEAECRTHTRDAAVQCFPFVKLAINDSFGPVQLLIEGRYRLVCANAFDDVDAQVVCRDLGFQFGKALFPGAFGYRSEAIKVTDVSCQGSEDHFMDCQMDKYGICPSSAYASVVCSKDGGSAYKVKLQNTDFGFVMIEHYEHDGYVCADGYDNKDAMVFCREAGFLTGFAYHGQDPNSKERILWLSNVTCHGNESRLDQCMQGNQTLAFGKHNGSTDCLRASAFCANTLDQTTVEWRLTQDDGRTTSRVTGRVEVKINGTWGTVCAHTFEQEEADVLCRRMHTITGSVIENTFGKGKVWVTSLDCEGSEDDPLDCQMLLDKHGVDNCDTAAVVCTAGVRVRPTVTIEPTRDDGIVEVVDQTTGYWIAVCATGFNNHSADLVCKEIGKVRGFYQTYTADGGEQMKFGAANITCTTLSTEFSQCQRSIDDEGVCPEAAYVYLFCSEEQNPDENVKVTLDRFTGLLMVSRYGFSGVVCGENFTDTEARVTCEERGYENGYALKPYRESTYPFVLSMLKCTGHEVLKRIEYCARGSFVTSGSDCSDGSAAHVLCTSNTDPIEYRVNPEGTEPARAEVKINGEWKLVDGYGFYSSEAKVFCRSAGYFTGRKSYDYVSDLPELPFAVGTLSCTGNETSLLECQGNWDLEKSVSNSFRDAIVECAHSVQLVRGTSSANGMLEYSGRYGWGPVCGEGFDNTDAAVVCRELGYPHGLSYSCCTPHGYSYGWFTMAHVNCSGTESSLGECPHTTDPAKLYDCDGDEYASLACYRTNDTTDYQLSIAGSLEDRGAIVMTFVGAEGRICSDLWDDNDARVACRELGFPNGMEAYSHYRTTYYYYDYSGPFWTSEFNCSGTETRLQDCPHITPGKVTECKNRHFAGVNCYETLGTLFRLTPGGNRTNYGRVDIRINGTWGTVCEDALDSDRDAVAVFCRSEGYVDGSLRAVPSDVPQATGPVYTNRLYCTGDEASLKDCAHRVWQESDSSYYCNDHSDDAGVFCYANVRLSTPDNVPHGAVRLFRNDSWVFISDDHFDDQTAAEVCRELGFADGRAVCCSAYMGSSSYYYGTIYRWDLALNCDGQDNLADCVIEGSSRLYPSVICKVEGEPFDDQVYNIDFEDNSDTADGTGRLHVEYLGIKGRICAINWTDEDAEVFCRSKGYVSGEAYSHSDRNKYMQHTEIGPYLLSNFSCVGNETNLMDCPHQDRLSLGNCTTGHSAGVACYSVSSVKYRLADGTANKGRVEIAVDNVWGTVCNKEWDNLDADVLCRSLNYSSGVRVPLREFGEGRGTIWLKEVQCVGTEESLLQCPHTGFFDTVDSSGSWWWYSPPCSDHDDDAAAYCYKNVRLNLVDSDMGGLKVYYKNTWMSVCDDDPFDDNAATVACKGLMMDFQYGIAIKGSAFGEMDSPMKIKSLRCPTGNESDILECEISEHGTCSSGYYASVACSQKPFVDEGFLVRITNDSYSGKAWGIVEIQKKGLWRKICHQGWDGDDANVVCKQTGYKGGVEYTHIVQHQRPMTFRNFTCSGKEDSLADCPYDTSPDLDECSYHRFDAGVLCYNTTGIQYVLASVNGSTGRVEIHYDGEIGAVCSHYWSYNDSRVFCRSLGYSDGLPVDESSLENPLRPLDQYFLNGPFCQGTESFLLECLTTGFNSSYLSYYCYDEAYVQCYNVTFSITDIRLVLADGRMGVDRGRLEVYMSGPNEWGTVCDDYWDDLDATVACVQLGFQWGEAVSSQTYGPGTGRIWLDNVECKGTETNLDQCIHRGYGTHNCWHFEDAGVLCYNTTRPTLPTTTSTTTVTTTTITTTTTTTTPTTTTTTPTTTTTTPTTTTTTPTTTTTTPTTTTSTPTTTTTTTPTTTTTSPTTPSSTITVTTPSTTTPVVTVEEKKNVVPIAVGAAVGVLLLLIIIVIVVVVVRRRRREIPHQQFSDEISLSADGSIAVQNQMYDGNLDEIGGSKQMAGEGEITLGGDRAMYHPDQQSGNTASADGFTNPLYSVMQPFRTEGATLSDNQNGRPGGDSKDV